MLFKYWVYIPMYITYTIRKDQEIKSFCFSLINYIQTRVYRHKNKYALYHIGHVEVGIILVLPGTIGVISCDQFV
jgi:hypothetical protein